MVRFSGIYVIESLPDGDPKTGRDLYDNVVFPVTRKLDNLHTQFATARNRDEFIKCLADVGRDVATNGRIPMLHLEAHGTPDGIELADQLQLTWKELVPLLGSINEACHMNLVVIAISCYGANLVSALMPSDRAPLFLNVGPRDTMKHVELLEATSRFYAQLVETLLTGGDINAAFDAMNAGVSGSGARIFVGTAEIYFCRVFRQYWAQQTEEALQARENDLVARNARERGADLRRTAAFREEVRRDLRDAETQYNHLRERFLMLDLFPENREKFGLTYELCAKP